MLFFNLENFAENGGTTSRPDTKQLRNYANILASHPYVDPEGEMAGSEGGGGGDK